MKIYKRIYNTPEYRKRYTGIYGSWYAMKQRCGNPNSLSFKDYGGRGITYCDRWESFKNFKQDMGDSYQEGLTIDRINNNGNYCKENCRWATREEQNNNTRLSVLIKGKTFSDWSKEFGISRGTIKSRYYRGMTINEILNSKLYRPQKI